MLLAMITILNIAVSNASEHHYWKIISHPLLSQILERGDRLPLTFVNENVWMSSPWDPRGPEKPFKEETFLYNYTLSFSTFPICLGEGELCLKLGNQAWFQTIHSTEGNLAFQLLSSYLLKWPGRVTNTVWFTNIFRPDLRAWNFTFVHSKF